MTVAKDVKAMEAVGPLFDREQMLETRMRTRAALHSIAAAIRPGMLEEEAVEFAKDTLADLGMLKGWHDVYVRFGRNTTKMFGHKSEPGVVLEENDIFFLDIGPVFKLWEGDAGETFTTGADPERARCAADAKRLFHIVRRQWESTGLNGRELYDYAAHQAQRLGWELNLEWNGHRVSEFPHAVHFDGSLTDLNIKPASLIWILEMHIRHPEGHYGAFFEDMLLDDSFFAGQPALHLP